MNYPARPRWDPFAELQSLRSELGRLLGGTLSGSGGGGWLPEIEVDSDDGGWTVTARLPGVAPDEVEIEVENRELHIRARTAEETEGEPRATRRRAFDHRLSLPGDVDVDKVDATMDHGLLTVRLPRRGQAARRRITIGEGGQP